MRRPIVRSRRASIIGGERDMTGFRPRHHPPLSHCHCVPRTLNPRRPYAGGPHYKRVSCAHASAVTFTHRDGHCDHVWLLRGVLALSSVIHGTPDVARSLARHSGRPAEDWKECDRKTSTLPPRPRGRDDAVRIRALALKGDRSHEQRRVALVGRDGLRRRRSTRSRQPWRRL
jgi:hypothetical protein